MKDTGASQDGKLYCPNCGLQFDTHQEIEYHFAKDKECAYVADQEIKKAMRGNRRGANS